MPNRRFLQASFLFVAIATLAVNGACSRDSSSKSASTPRPLSTQSAGSLAWRDCSDGFECASLPLPLDFTKPQGATIQIALIRMPAAAADKRIGSLLVNPGGPGASGVDFVRDAASEVFSQQIRDRFDIVGFDPRGVGASTPAVRCIDNPGAYISGIQATPGSADQQNLDRLADASFAKACGDRSGAILGYLSAPHVARDMEAIRIALGDEQLTYVGFSYGALLGATYADLFPKTVRALVLDGAIDPSLTPEEQGARQDDGFNQALDAFLGDCADNNGCPFNNDGDTGKAFDDLIDRIEKDPLPAVAAHDDRKVDADAAWTAISAALYSESEGWPRLAKALAQAQKDGDGSGLLALEDHYYDRSGDGSYSNEFEANIAINCVDAPDHTTRTPGTATAPPSRATPTPGHTEPPSSSPCDFWPVAPDRTPAAIAARDAPPILVVGTTGDPAAPYREAQAMAEQLRSGRLLTYDGEGHTAYGGINSCIDRMVDAYLIRLEIPPYGTTCSAK
jgi:pimeloyl-ACP methyl ester carboxylesterase